MPTGKVKWYDAEKGFGFLSQPEGPDVYVRSDALPEGVTTLKAGTRVEFGIAQGRRGDQALQVKVLDAPASVTRNQRNAQRKDPDAMVAIVEDLIRLLDGVGETYRHGRHPEAKTARPTAKLLRALADLGLESRDLRVRDLGGRASIELDRDLLRGPLSEGARAEDVVVAAVVAAGFAEAAIDPRGFRSGSLNEALAAE